MLVVGCKQNEELSVEEHREGTNAYQHIWKAEYNNDTYTRSALQFGKGNLKVKHAEVQVEMDFPANGKAGLLFAVNPREAGEGENKKTVYDFYAFAFGKDPNETNKLEAYVDYYQGLESFNDTSSTSEQFGTGSYVEVVKSKDLNKTWDGISPVEVKMIIERNETTGSDKKTVYTYDLSIVDNSGTELWAEKGVTIAGKEGSKINSELVVNEGNIYSYGMLSKNATNPKKVDTTWTLDEESFVKTGTGTIIAAEDAE